eukprot:TRINITY_DN4776_c1_g1_i1.p1 TRINITY_DN4776_c1_g1~~TRINITY_DN4776_c1_g1_i1.p1  ORF type:complete len:260 (+),score=43.91 TRINITY_DN4776_c1_g1_i1:66-845(+)
MQLSVATANVGKLVVDTGRERCGRIFRVRDAEAAIEAGVSSLEIIGVLYVDAGCWCPPYGWAAPEELMEVSPDYLDEVKKQEDNEGIQVGTFLETEEGHCKVVEMKGLEEKLPFKVHYVDHPHGPGDWLDVEDIYGNSGSGGLLQRLQNEWNIAVQKSIAAKWRWANSCSFNPLAWSFQRNLSNTIVNLEGYRSKSRPIKICFVDTVTPLTIAVLYDGIQAAIDDCQAKFSELQELGIVHWHAAVPAPRDAHRCSCQLL